MPDVTVEQSGGDFTTLNAALTDAGRVNGDTITIQGAWTIDDTATCTVQEDDITVQIVAGNASYPDGLYDESNQHYRLVTAAGNCITVNNIGFTLDGVAVVQAGIGVSDECVRLANTGINTFRRSLFRSTGDISDQDGIFGTNGSVTVNVENCIFYRFGRAAIQSQVTAGGPQTHIWNINSSSIEDCTTFVGGGEGQGGGISIRATNSDLTININVFNTFVGNGNVGGGSADYNESGAGATVTWGISFCISSDASISARDVGGIGNLENRTFRIATTAGDEVLVINLTDASKDLHLVDDAINNDAQHAHSTITAEGLTLPILDIDDETRDRGAGRIDIGADSILLTIPIGFPSYGQVIFQPTGPEYAQPLSETGDTFPQYGQILVVDPKPLYGQKFLKEADDDQYGQRIVRN